MNAKLIEYDLENLADEEEYQTWLDDIYGEINIGVKLNASDVLKQCDPVAYRCGFNDHVDSFPERWECENCGMIHNDKDDADDCCWEE